MKRCVFNLLFLLFTLATVAQQKETKSYLQQYANFPFVYLSRTDIADLTVKKGKLQVMVHHHEQLLITKNNLNATRSIKVRTDSFVQIRELKAFHEIKQTDRYKKKTIKTIELQSENDGAGSFYDDDQFYKISFLEAKEGDLITIDYDVAYLEPHFFGSHYFSDYYPSVHNRFEVHFPINDIQLRQKLFNNQNLAIKISVDSLKKIKTLAWQADSIEPLTEDWMEPSFRHKGSYLLIGILNYKGKDSLVPVCGSLQNLYSWYEALTKNVDAIPDPDLIALTDSITKPYTSDEEKLTAIFEWVREKISYLAYEDGINGFVPREASIVCKQRYGDCKDMANLLVRMGTIAHLPVYRAWIGTRDIPYQFSEFPTPACANHMIAVYFNGKDTLFLDATGKGHSFGTPTAMIRGKEALVGMGKGQYTIAKVPDAERSFSVISDSVIVRVAANNLLKGEGYYRLSGYDKLRLFRLLEKKNYEKRLKIMKGELEKGNNKFKLDTIQVMQYAVNVPLVIYYQFTIPDYAVNTDGHTMLNLNFNRDYLDYLSFSKRKYPVDFSYSSTHELKVRYELDDKQRVDFLPENMSAENNQLSFALKYKALDKEVEFSSIIGINASTINRLDFESCDKLITTYKKNRSNLVSISPK